MKNNIQIIVNFKLHKNGCGKNTKTLAKICEKVAIETGTNIAIAINAIEIKEIIKTVNIPVLAQHITSPSTDSATGHITAQIIKESGASGSLLNHVENRIKSKSIKSTLAQANKENLNIIFCTKTIRESEKIAKLHKNIKPSIIAFEPARLIGSNISITSKYPKAIKKLKTKIGNTKLFVGAGIKTPEDIKKAIELGANGILIASVITKSTDPYTKLTELANAFKAPHN